MLYCKTLEFHDFGFEYNSLRVFFVNNGETDEGVDMEVNK